MQADLLEQGGWADSEDLPAGMNNRAAGGEQGSGELIEGIALETQPVGRWSRELCAAPKALGNVDGWRHWGIVRTFRGGLRSGVGRHASAPKGSTLQFSARAAPGSNRARANSGASAIGIETMLRNRTCWIVINFTRSKNLSWSC